MLRSTLFKRNALAMAIGFISAGAGISATAQEGNNPSIDAPDLRLEEVLVTAQKRVESLQDVPISVATVTGEKLADAGIETLEDLTAYLPNIHFTESGFSTQVRVRGIGSDNSQGFEQSVGMYIDGIYYGRAQLFRTPMMDMERAELLRGPQSTLFGKNSISGALNLTTAAPTEEFEGKLTVSHEFEHEQDELNLVLSGPLSDNLRARLAVRTYEEAGYFRNTYKNVDEPNSEEDAARVTIDWTPTDQLSFLFKAEKNEFSTKGRAIEITKDDPVDQGPNDDVDNTFAEFLQLVSVPVFDPNLNYERQTDLPEFSDNEITNLTLTTNYEFNDHTLTLVTGQLEYDYTELCDCDFVSAEILELDLLEDYEQFSQEIRIASPVGEEIEWLAGVFYQEYDQTFEDDLYVRGTSVIGRTTSVIADTTASRDFEQSSDAWAIFGRVTWNVTERLHLTLGARYTEEKKSASKAINIYDANDGSLITDPVVGYAYLTGFLLENNAATINFDTDENGLPTADFGQAYSHTGHDVSASRDESAFTPLLNVEYDFSDDMMVYATYTTGFKAGGFDPRSNSVGNFAEVTTDPELNPTRNFEFEEEEVTAIELGMKTTLADGRGEVNVAIYRTDYEDLQISQFDGGVGFNVGNAKETVVQGIELDGRWLLAEGLTGSYGFSYLDFEYKDFRNGNCNMISALSGSGEGTVDLNPGDPDGLDSEGNPIYELCDYTGKRGVYTPEYTYNLGLDYLRSLTENITLVSFLDIQHVDSHNVHVNLDPDGEIDAYMVVNARLGLEGDNWAVGVLGKNLLDEKILTYSANAPLSDSQAGSNTHYSFVRRPMTIAVEGTYKF